MDNKILYNSKEIEIKCPECGNDEIELFIVDHRYVKIKNNSIIGGSLENVEYEFYCDKCGERFLLEDIGDEVGIFDHLEINGINIWEYIERMLAYGYFFPSDIWNNIEKTFLDSKLYKSFMKFMKRIV